MSPPRPSAGCERGRGGEGGRGAIGGSGTPRQEGATRRRRSQRQRGKWGGTLPRAPVSPPVTLQSLCPSRQRVWGSLPVPPRHVPFSPQGPIGFPGDPGPPGDPGVPVSSPPSPLQGDTVLSPAVSPWGGDGVRRCREPLFSPQCFSVTRQPGGGSRGVKWGGAHCPLCHRGWTAPLERRVTVGTPVCR